ncbi:MAG TPA: DUF559 domain-containing protein [Lichenihabitans sp.]|jgi:very-short-patch-repair endonuclease|nr:DUF559 domain-containing protein [Lichenihabitans sp.]
MQHTASITFARSLRRAMTEVERQLWYKLRDRRLGGLKFVRQHPVGPFFADFCHRDGKLIIEIDGSQHAANTRDKFRDAYLIDQGYRVLRFWNQDVSADIDNVCDTILAAVDGRLEPYERYKTKSYPSPLIRRCAPPSPRTRGEGRQSRRMSFSPLGRRWSEGPDEGLQLIQDNLR